jgi:multisubunit Na+/H+ antiporter MnhC subunit
MRIQTNPVIYAPNVRRKRMLIDWHDLLFIIIGTAVITSAVMAYLCNSGPNNVNKIVTDSSYDQGTVCTATIAFAIVLIFIMSLSL